MDKLAEALISKAKETPYFHLMDKETGEIYMERYWLKPFSDKEKDSIRIHHIMRSDNDRALHDHPWPSTSIILSGGYWEIEPEEQEQDPRADSYAFTRTWKGPGAITSRAAHDRHRLEVPPGGSAWTMFIMGAWERDWGFHDPETGFVYWREYLNDYVTSTSTDKGMT